MNEYEVKVRATKYGMFFNESRETALIVEAESARDAGAQVQKQIEALGIDEWEGATEIIGIKKI